jgi:hypothetical protein
MMSAFLFENSTFVGLHLRQALKPASSAASADAKNETFSCLGVLDEHDGRQKIPVVRTPK